MTRVPVTTPLSLPHATRDIQVNHCRMPDCDNYGVPPRIEKGKPGPSVERDPHYNIVSTNKGRVPSLKCKCCGEKPPIKGTSIN